MYNQYFHINKNFQSSINLELDLNNENKINEYIPTTDICDVLKKYIKTILNMNNERATTLVGPYGKGKSFLLLILTYLLGKNKHSTCWSNLVEKIKKVDKELFDLLIKIKKEDISLLPIIINSNYDNIKQAFQIALNEALKKAELNDIIPKTAYNICLELLDKWEKDENIKKNIYKKCVEINKIDPYKLRLDLISFSQEAYHKFEKLYNCINIGLEFNPLINNDVVKIYSDIAREITKKGYNGMFIVFDEFSKFLEGNSNSLMQDLVILQGFAELSTRSKKNCQINLCCVTHKSVTLYFKKNKSDVSKNSFNKIEGRFIEIKFNRSLDENYQLISNAINKDSGYEKRIDSFLKDNESFYTEMKQLNIFSNNNIRELLFKGCFPLNPLTVFALVQLSEYVAQNERTLFTFLSDSDEHSFNTFITNNSNGLFNLDKIYDYFNNLFQKQETNFIRNIWYRAEAMLSKVENNLEKQVIKTIAIITMINDYDKLPSNELIIALALNENTLVVKNVIQNLIDMHLIRKNTLNNMLSFAILNSKQVDETINYLSKTKFKNINYCNTFEKINDKPYIIPRKYNEINKITRFFSVIFVTEEELLNISDFNNYFENKYCDGLIVNLLNKSLNDDQIYERINKINDSRVIIRCPSNKINNDFYELSMRYICLEEIINKSNLDEVSTEELKLLIDEVSTDLKYLINLYFEKDFKFYSSIKNEMSFQMFISYVMSYNFSKKLIFNNELINKKNVSSQYQKAINHVIDFLLQNCDDFNYSDTSPETSVRYSILDFNENDQEFRTVIDEIKGIISLSNNKINVNTIIDKYLKSPYGIRDGVVPVILAKAISELSDNVILYLANKEIELNAINLVKAIQSEKYFLSFSKSSNEQKQYLIKLIKLFNIQTVNNFRKDTKNLAEKIKAFFIGQPKIIRLSTINNNILNIDDNYLMYKNIFLNFNINSYEVIYVEPKKIFSTKKYDELFRIINNIKNIFENKILEYKQELIIDIKKCFKINSSTSLIMGLTDWLNQNVIKKNKIILSDLNQNIYSCILNDLNHDDVFSVNKLVKASLNIFIEDWDVDNKEEFIKIISRFISEIEKADVIDDDTQDLINLTKNMNSKELTPMGNLLKNNVLSAIEEYGDSVSASEKITILTELIKKML